MLMLVWLKDRYTHMRVFEKVYVAIILIKA